MYWRVSTLGETVAILASGESMTIEDADAVAHLPRIAINLTARMAPTADIVYASDAMFWHAYPDVMLHQGVKVSVEQQAGIRPNVPLGVRVLRMMGSEGLTDRTDGVYVGGQSGYAAINLAVAAGAKRILLLGMDMQGGHWHGKHVAGLGNPGAGFFVRSIRRMNRLADWLKQAGIEVINCSPVSALECFKRCPVRECL